MLISVIDVDVSPMRHENNNTANIVRWVKGTVHVHCACIAIFSCKMSIPLQPQFQRGNLNFCPSFPLFLFRNFLYSKPTSVRNVERLGAAKILNTRDSNVVFTNTFQIQDFSPVKDNLQGCRLLSIIICNVFQVKYFW